MIIILCGHRYQTQSSRIFLSVPLKDMGNNRTRSQRELRWILIRPELATCEECFPIPGSYYEDEDELGWVHALNAVGLRRAWVNGMRLLYTYTLWMRCFLWKRVEEGASKPAKHQHWKAVLATTATVEAEQNLRRHSFDPSMEVEPKQFYDVALQLSISATTCPCSPSLPPSRTVRQSFIVKSKAFYTAELPCFDWA